jgi:hypothetical protein
MMLDIETLALSESQSLILSVGLIEFALHKDGPELLSEVVLHPNIEEQLLLGRRVDSGTQKWWKGQNVLAQMSLIRPERVLLHNFCGALGASGTAVDEVWANGICFDLCNLVELCEQVGAKRPWKYNAARDARTVYSLPVLRGEEYTLGAVAHNPIDDCKMQIHRLWQHWPGMWDVEPVTS